MLTLCPGPTESEAAELQGMDVSKAEGLMSAEEVARVTLENIGNGPTFVSHPSYKATMDHLMTMPRRDVLEGSAQAMKALTAPKG